jgi:lipopolysaccharide biosynthesis regulator YciM
MSDIKGRIKQTVRESRLYKDFSTLTNELLKNQSAEAVKRANEIIEDEVEELAEQVSLLIKS